MKTLTRTEAIALLRQKCLALVDDEHSLCNVAARLHILCGGFSRWKSRELEQRHDWIVKQRPGIRRKELEDLANRWQLARQSVLDTPLACDTQLQETLHRTCLGWDEFSEADLASFCAELGVGEFQVVPDPGASAAPGR